MKGARIYIASRSETKANKAIEVIKSAVPNSSSVGELRFLHLQLDDLSTIKSSAEAFKAQESKLDVLWNNAGISLPPAGSISAQGHELHIATNALGPYLFTTLLLPELRAAARGSGVASTRVIWTSSLMVDSDSPKGGVALSELDLAEPTTDQPRNYAISKAANMHLASELDRRERSSGIVSITQNPGNLKTDIWNGAGILRYLVWPILYASKFGAYTELWSGLSPEVKVEDGGRFAVPWGKWHPGLRKDLIEAMKSEEEGGSGISAKFWEWCEEKTKDFV